MKNALFNDSVRRLLHNFGKKFLVSHQPYGTVKFVPKNRQIFRKPTPNSSIRKGRSCMFTPKSDKNGCRLPFHHIQKRIPRLFNSDRLLCVRKFARQNSPFFAHLIFRTRFEARKETGKHQQPFQEKRSTSSSHLLTVLIGLQVRIEPRVLRKQ